MSTEVKKDKEGQQVQEQQSKYSIKICHTDRAMIEKTVNTIQ